MSGWFEVRVNGPNRHHYRLFCLLDDEAEGTVGPLLTVIAGLDRPFKTSRRGHSAHVTHRPALGGDR